MSKIDFYRKPVKSRVLWVCFKNLEQEFIKNKYDILGLNDKKNFNKSNNQDFNFLFLVNKDMDNDLTRNSLYKIYHEEITLKSIRNAKRSTIFLNMNRNMNMNLHY